MRNYGKKYSIIYIVFLLGISQLITSCKFLTPSVMLRTGHDYPYAQFDTTTQIMDKLYKISVNDELSIALYSDGGSTLIDVVGGGNLNNNGNGGGNNTNSNYSTNNSSQQRNGNSVGGSMYTVEFDGTVRIPVVGRVKIEGMNVREVQEFLENEFSEYYNKPFVIARVLNKRVIIFNGEGNSTSVVPLIHENTTLFEAIAESGGIQEKSKAYRIKLIRGNLKTPKVFLIDLSTLKGVTQADLTLQANDIIYVESIQNYPEKFLERLAPYMTVFNTTILAVAFIKVYVNPSATTQ